jgi:dinuclear metal center YbgI/SA1388 family protein
VTPLADVIARLEALAPTSLAEPWDNVGLLVGDPVASVTGALFCVDLTAEVLDEARAQAAELVVAYHPPIFGKLDRFVAPHLAFRCARAGVAVWSPHTALDAAEGGTNDVLADQLGVVGDERRRALRAAGPPPPSSSVGLVPDGVTRAGPAAAPAAAASARVGMGRVGPLLAPAPRRALVERVRVELGLDHLLVAGPLEGDARIGAVCAGAGGELLSDAIRAGADVLLTGELRHHDALRATAAGVTVIATLHSRSERLGVARFCARAAAALPAVRCFASARDADPFRIL